MQVIIINNISVSVDSSFEDASAIGFKKLKSLGVRASDFKSSRIYRKSVDARKKNDVKIVYSIAYEVKSSKIAEDKLSKINACYELCHSPEIKIGKNHLPYAPVIVGSGPAGLFCALLLAENGYKPIVLERGGSVSERIAAVEKFKQTKELDCDTNIQFGAGGAGTFSDGKLITRINDPFSSYVIKRLIEFGAPEDIAYMAKPHVGTDILCKVVDAILNKIVELGGSVRYHTNFIDADFENNKISRIKTSSGDLPVGALVLAIGHSARDTYSTIIKRGLPIEAKNFSVGMRIEHLASDIDEAMYGSFAGHKALGHAEYALSSNTKSRGVYTFCMCPGGVVVPAASEYGGVVVNGMSYRARDCKNSNSAIVCSIFKEDFGNDPDAAIQFQRKIERAAFKSGGNDYTAPIISVGDFLDGSLKNTPARVQPSYMDGKVRIASPYEYLPSFVCDNIKNSLLDFDKKIHGFASADAILTGAETRTSAPIRILRNNTTYLALGYDNLYPSGEGAGYAGGITSAAIDGVRVALSIIKEYSPIQSG